MFHLFSFLLIQNWYNYLKNLRKQKVKYEVCRYMRPLNILKKVFSNISYIVKIYHISKVS